MISVIETHDLCKSYNGRIVVEHLNLSVPQGCVYGFLGPNGAGKSTSMKILLGLVHPTSGSVKLLGQTMNEENRIALLRKTGSLIESPSGYLHLTARENLKIIADLKDIDHKDIDRVLEIVHLTADANRKVGQYSLGMKQRLGIAMALLGNPRLLILDEPTNGLDPAGIQEMRGLIASMPESTGATVLISSHLLGEMEQMVTQLGILDHGKMIFEGSLQELRKHSRGGIQIRVLDVKKGIDILNRQGILTQPMTHHLDILQLPSISDEKLAELVRTLSENNVGVVGLTSETKSLEEIFLSLTQNVLERGGLYDAIRASISIPSVFRPVRRGNMVLVDGGTVNPLPLNRVRREPGDVLVAVDVSAPFSDEMAARVRSSLNYYKVITASSEIMQQHIARLMCEIYKPDLLIEMPADRFGIFEFYRAREIVEAGRLAARAALEQHMVVAG